jgi:hypothetical protein
MRSVSNRDGYRKLISQVIGEIPCDPEIFRYANYIWPEFRGYLNL